MRCYFCHIHAIARPWVAAATPRVCRQLVCVTVSGNLCQVAREMKSVNVDTMTRHARNIFTNRHASVIGAPCPMGPYDALWAPSAPQTSLSLFK